MASSPFIVTYPRNRRCEGVSIPWRRFGKTSGWICAGIPPLSKAIHEFEGAHRYPRRGPENGGAWAIDQRRGSRLEQSPDRDWVERSPDRGRGSLAGGDGFRRG